MQPSDAAAQGHTKIMVRTVDTNVVVLAVSCVLQWSQLEELWVHIGTGKNHQFLPCHAIAASLGPEKAEVLPMFHAFSGCDTVSSFAGKGKKSAFEAWGVYPPAKEGFTCAEEENVEQALPILEKIIIALYDKLNNNSWVEELSTVLLGLRVAIRTDVGVSAAEYTFGRTLRLPGDFYDINTEKEPDNASNLVQNLRKTISTFRPTQSHSNSKAMFVHPKLKDCEFVFMRDDAIHKSLKPPYEGPYKVLERGTKVFLVQLPNRQAHISVDRLKPAFVLNEHDTSVPSQVNNSDNTTTNGDAIRMDSSKTANLAQDTNVTNTKTTRSGRVIRPPVKFY